jgi:UDP-glucose 4-epimerase
MFGLDYVALRYFNVYGPRMDMDGKYTEVLIRWLDCIREEKPPVIYGVGNTTMDLVYVTDVAKANVAALTSVISDQVINVGNNHEISLRQLLNMLLKVNKSNLVPISVSDNKINPVSRRLADNTKARNILEYVPSYTLEQGLSEMCNWYFEKQQSKIAAI